MSAGAPCRGKNEQASKTVRGLAECGTFQSADFRPAGVLLYRSHLAGQDDLPALLFVPTTHVLSFYDGLLLNGLVDNRTRLWTIALTDYILWAGVMLVINGMERACSSYRAKDPRSDHVDGSLLFSLEVKILDALKYFGTYKFVQRIGTDPVLTAMAFYLCSEIDLQKTAV